MRGFRRGNSSPVALRFHVDLLPFEGGALVERKQLEEEFYLQPTPVKAERLEQDKEDDDHPVDRAFQAVGGSKRGDAVLNMRRTFTSRAERRGDAGHHSGNIVLEVGQERIEHDNEDRPQHGAVQAEYTADQDHDDELDRQLQREHFRADEGQLVGEQTAGKSGDGSADRKGLDLVERYVDAHASRRRFAVADRDERPAGRGAQQIERADDGQNQHAKAEEVESRTVARHRRAEPLNGLDAHAFVALRHAFPPRQDFLDNERKGDRGDDEIDALQPQRRKSDERADKAGQQPGGQKIDRERDVELLQIRHLI